MKKNVLVTGGAGFIGSHIVDELIDRKFNVIVLDNLISGNKDFLNSKADFIKGDINDAKKIKKIFESQKISAILHLAGQPSIINSFTNPLLDIETNFLGTVNLITLALAYNIQRFLYASSMTVYGNPRKNPVTESEPCIPINYYGTAKYASERFVHITSDRVDLKRKIQVTSFRMFNVYGPRQSLKNPYQGVLAIFMGNVLRNEPITIYGDGKQARDFVFVKDVARVWVEAINNEDSFGRIFNIGYGRKTDITTLSKKVIRACGKNPSTYSFNYRSERPGDQKIVEADISFAKRYLKYSPHYPLQEGLNETLIWAKEDNAKKA